MISVVKRYICDACGKEFCIDPEHDIEGWTSSEVGDLCPSCSRAWDNYKESFIERMRKDNGQPLA